MCDFERINSRLHDLTKLESGWNEGEGEPFDISLVNRLSECFSHNYPKHMPEPHIYPDLDNIVRFEWQFKTNHVDMDINLSSMDSTVYCYDTDSDFLDEEQANLNSSSFWKSLETKIAQAMGENNV